MQIYSKLFLNFTDCLCKLTYKMKNNLELRDYFWDTLMIFFHAYGESLLDVVEYKRKQILCKLNSSCLSGFSDNANAICILIRYEALEMIE